MGTEDNITALVVGDAAKIPGSEPEVQSRGPSNVALLHEFPHAAGVQLDSDDTDSSKPQEKFRSQLSGPSTVNSNHAENVSAVNDGLPSPTMEN